MNLGPYAVFIIAAYGAAIVIVACLIAWIVIDGAHLRRLIGEIEAQGVARRSHRPNDDKA
jgi:heme exporter protein D